MIRWLSRHELCLNTAFVFTFTNDISTLEVESLEWSYQGFSFVCYFLFHGF